MPPEELRSRTYPRLVDSQGEAPPQYPDWDDDEIWEIDEGEI